MALAAYLILAIGLVAIAGWALQRFRPSAFSRYPGGITEFTRRGKIVVAVYVLAALTVGALTSGTSLLFAIALGVIFGGPLLIVVFMWWTSRSRPVLKSGKMLSPAAMQAALERGTRQMAEERRQRWQQQLEGLVFPYQLVAGAEAEAAYEAARLTGQAEGYTPLIITPASSRVAPGLSRDELMTEARRVIAAAPAAQEFFAARTAAWSRYDEDGRRQRWLAEAQAFVAQPITATRAPDLRKFAVRDAVMHTLRETLGEKPPFPYVREAALVRIPTPRAWEIPAYTLYGGWNDCPNPEQMVAVARHWNENYGADICALGDGTLEFRVQRPPAALRQAFELWREHLLFCDEGVDDLIGMPQVFAEILSHLPKEKYWLFWWD